MKAENSHFLRILVLKLTLKMQVNLQGEQGQTQGPDSEEFSAFIFTKATEIRHARIIQKWRNCPNQNISLYNLKIY